MGDVLAGKYRVERVLGHGGMGVVVAAKHLHLDQHVAIKFLLPDALQHPDVVERFAREARAASKVLSEHAAKIIDVGTLDSGAPYMVMEYLEGNDLAHEIEKRGTLAVEDIASHVLQALEALAEAHKAGIVHRDIKPANLFLARRPDKTSIIKVLDFGISKLARGDGGAVTHTTAVMGSPLYMSPEQLVSSKTVDARSDIWSIGIVMYEALTGAPPYRAETMPEIVALILQAPLEPLRELRPDVPQALADVVARCLEKDPNARYANVAELARDLAPHTPDGRRSFDRISRVLDVDPSASAPGTVTQPLALSNPIQPGSATENPAWTASPANKKRSPWLPVGAVIVLLVGLGVGYKVVSSPATITATTPPATAIATAPASTTAAAATPVTLPALETAPEPSATAPSASAPPARPPPAVHTTAPARASAAPSTAAPAASSAPPADTTPAPASSKKHFILK